MYSLKKAKINQNFPITIINAKEQKAFIGVDGKSEQETRSGKNLVKLSDFVSVNSATTTTILETGINIKNVTTGYGSKIDITGLKQNTNYYIQYIWTNISNGINRVRVFAGTTQTTTLYSGDNLSGFTFNTGSNTTINIWFYAGLDTIGEVTYTNMQLEERNNTDFL